MGGIYLKVGCDKEFIVIWLIKLKELMSFDFYFYGSVVPRAMALGGAYYFFVPNVAPIQGWC